MAALKKTLGVFYKNKKLEKVLPPSLFYINFVVSDFPLVDLLPGTPLYINRQYTSI